MYNTYPDFICHLGNKTHVMRNQHHSSLERIHGISQGINTLHVTDFDKNRVNTHFQSMRNENDKVTG